MIKVVFDGGDSFQCPKGARLRDEGIRKSGNAISGKCIDLATEGALACPLHLTDTETHDLYTSTCDNHNFVLKYTYTRMLYTVVRVQVFQHFDIP